MHWCSFTHFGDMDAYHTSTTAISAVRKLYWKEIDIGYIGKFVAQCVDVDNKDVRIHDQLGFTFQKSYFHSYGRRGINFRYCCCQGYHQSKFLLMYVNEKLQLTPRKDVCYTRLVHIALMGCSKSKAHAVGQVNRQELHAESDNCQACLA